MSNAATLPAGTATDVSFGPLRGIVRFFSSFNAAVRCYDEIRANRRPALRDLQILGLEDVSFDNLRR